MNPHETISMIKRLQSLSNEIDVRFNLLKNALDTFNVKSQLGDVVAMEAHEYLDKLQDLERMKKEIMK